MYIKPVIFRFNNLIIVYLISDPYSKKKITHFSNVQ